MPLGEEQTWKHSGPQEFEQMKSFSWVRKATITTGVQLELLPLLSPLPCQKFLLKGKDVGMSGK